MAQPEDAVRRFLKGDDDAFRIIVRQWEAKIYNLALRFLGNREDAQDTVQETFLSVFRAIKTLRDPQSFPSWLYQIAVNHCRSRWRARSSDLSLDDSIATGNGEDGEVKIAQVFCQESSDNVETADLIRKALIGVSEDHRMAVLLKEYLGLSLEELAKVMDCPLSTAKSRLYHGLRAVQLNLKKLGVCR
jgi:RNA polymerase sigma-70 factor, ECF subfamily